MDETETVILKQKKRKVAIDPEEQEDEIIKAIPTKTAEENIERKKQEHKENGEKAVNQKKVPEHKDDKKVTKKEESKNTAPKPKASVDKDTSNVKKDPEHKTEAKPKTAAPATDKKKPEINGQPKQSKEEKKAPEKSQQKPKKKGKESDFDSEESEEESDSESESEDEVKKKPKKAPQKKETPKKETPKKEKKGPGENKNKGSKNELIYDILKRWWYAMPDWPPANFDYGPELLKNNLRKVDFKYWKLEPEMDSKGLKKVYEVPSYPGVFKDSKGETTDLRPKENCPSYSNLKTKSIDELLDLAVKAFRGQIEALEKTTNYDKALLNDLKKFLTRAEKTQEARKKSQK